MANGLPSKAQLDRLGDRLRAGTATAEDHRILVAYRDSFRVAFDEVKRILDSLGFKPITRPAKITQSIIEKLRREKIRLTQIQDIAGLRVVVTDVIEQDQLVERLRFSFREVDIQDRRLRPSHGYRAIHLIVPVDERVVEIQVRTPEQHLWAQVSEKLADVVDPAIKYGGGPAELQRELSEYSTFVYGLEHLQRGNATSAVALQSMKSKGFDLESDPDFAGAVYDQMEEGKLIQELRRGIAKRLNEMAARFER